MTSIDLVHDLADYLAEKFAQWSLPSKKENDQKIKVFKGFLPEPRGAIVKGKTPVKDGPDDYASNFPCVVIQFVKSTDTEERTKTATTVEVTLTACTYDKTESADGKVLSDSHDNQGWEDPLVILEYVKLCLQSDRYLGHDGKNFFYLLPPLVITSGPVQEFPTYSAEMSLRFETFRPKRKRDWDYDFRPTEKSKPDLDNLSEVRQVWQNEK